MIYDLSQPVFHNAPHWATHPPITVTLEEKIAVGGFNAEHLKFTTHSGTHIRAPFHFVAGAEAELLVWGGIKGVGTDRLSIGGVEREKGPPRHRRDPGEFSSSFDQRQAT